MNNILEELFEKCKEFIENATLKELEEFENSLNDFKNSNTWIYEKFKGDMAIYAICPYCGFTHCPSRLNTETMQSEIVYQYKHCPECGKYLYDSSDDDVDVIWNDRWHPVFEEVMKEEEDANE